MEDTELPLQEILYAYMRRLLKHYICNDEYKPVLIFESHPIYLFSIEHATKRFAKLQEAWENISDPQFSSTLANHIEKVSNGYIIISRTIPRDTQAIIMTVSNIEMAIENLRLHDGQTLMAAIEQYEQSKKER